MSKLQFRARSKRPAEEPEATPFGIPIYELLADEKSRLNTKNKGTNAPPPSKKRRTNKALLAQKYKPNEFFDLLGNDDSNRKILKWLTQWDRAIKRQFVPSEDLDELGRPLHKVMLISGPPGVGKTTAAHICAIQKGFEVFEVNASDDRGSNAVKDKISTALGSHLVNTQKPVCIIADEVDGATEHGFIRALMTLIKNGSQLPGQNTYKNGQKSKHKHLPLMRPVIAICNELYAPALRPLRSISEIVKFDRHAPALLIHRLEKICRMENLKLNTKELNSLVEKHQCDLRACLNDLQFVNTASTLSSSPSTLSTPSTISIASSIASSNPTRSNSLYSDLNSTDPYFLARMQFEGVKPVSIEQFDTCTDCDKLLDSLFANYLDVEFVDDMLKKPNEFADYLWLADNYNPDLKPVVASAFGHYFRPPSVNGALVKSKQSDQSKLNSMSNAGTRYEAFKQTNQIVQQVLSHAECPQLRSTTSKRTAVLELVPFLTRVALPIPERAKQAAQVLKSAGVLYKHTNESLVLEPAIELAAVFDEQKQELTRTGQFLVRAQGLEVFAQTKPVNAREPKEPEPMEPRKGTSKAEKANSGFKELNADAKVWVQFSEGFSNAVRKPITWSDLFN